MSTSVAERSKASAAMVEATKKGRALMGGTTAMRKAGETYLPRFKSEDPADHEVRVKQSWLFNGYKKTLCDMVGRVFDKPVELAQAPSQIEGWADNIDMQGRDLSTFASELFKDGLSAGVSYIMVDAPRREGDTTQAQAQAQNLRPYFVHLSVEDVLGWKTEVYNNVTALSQIRIMETVDVPGDDEFSSKEEQQIRVMDRRPSGVHVRLYRKGNDEKWSQVEEYDSEASEITVVPVYIVRTGFFVGEPPLNDLADVNIAHWQSQSDQRNILHFARVPILHISGRESDDEPLTYGAGTAIVSNNPEAKIGWVEHSGQAINSGRQDLKDLEFQMETFGLQLLVARSQSATGAALDAAKETSQLAMMADALKDALEQAFVWMAEYAGITGKQTVVSVNTDFGVSMLTPQEVTALLTAVNTGQITRRLFLSELARRGFIRADIDVDDEIEQLDLLEPDLEDGSE